jgi:hypothetical protein
MPPWSTTSHGARVRVRLQWWSCLDATRKHLHSYRPLSPGVEGRRLPGPAGSMPPASAFVQIPSSSSSLTMKPATRRRFSCGPTVSERAQCSPFSRNRASRCVARAFQTIDSAKSAICIAADYPLMRISKKLDCSAETVRQALLRAGVTLRRQQERGPL